MNDNTAKIINLEDYLQGRLPIKGDVIQTLLDETRSRQNEVRKEVGHVLLREHRLKDVEPLRDKLIKYDILLLDVSSFLEKEIAGTVHKDQKEKQEALLKLCAGLQSINEKTKKLVTDDIANHKSNSIDLIKAAGAILVTPFSVEKIVEAFVSKQPAVLTAATNAGAALGIYIAFARQFNVIGKKAGKIIVQLPGRVKSTRRQARNAAFALTMSISVAAKRGYDIEARQPDRLAVRPKTMIVAKM